MKNRERYKILQSLCHAYCHEEARQSTGKDSSVAMIHARGMLQGACMALNLRFVDSGSAICIRTKCYDKEVLCYRKPGR